MTYITSIGLDVHARSVSACAFDPFTGEVTQRRFGTDAGEIAEWILGFESPKAVYESGPTGFALCRELRALGVDCVVGAVSKMQKPSAEKRRKNDRRDAAFLARLLATRNITEVWVPPVEAEAARDLSRALDDAREDLQRARQRLSKFLLRRGLVFDETDALGRRRGAWTRAFWRWAESCRPSDPAAAAAFDHYVACARCAESDKRALEKRVLAEARADRWRGAVEALSCIKGIDAVTAFCLATEAGMLLQVPHRRRLRLLARPRALRALERREGGQRRHHQDRELRLQARPRRGGVALQVVLAEAQGAAGRLGRAGGREAALRRRHRAPPPEARIPRGGRQAALRRQRRGRPRARLLGLGGRQARRGDARVAPRGPHSLPAGRARASTHRRDRLTTLFMGSPRAAPDYRDSKVFRNDGPGRRIEMR